MNAREIIRAEYGSSRNFFTNHRVKVGSIKRGQIAYELSWGTGILQGTYCAGVSVASVVCPWSGKTKREHDMSTSFSAGTLGDALKKARAYIEELKKEYST